eukprot:Nk52_evm11s96 gene=Nk52_evmTU11s96
MALPPLCTSANYNNTPRGGNLSNVLFRRELHGGRKGSPSWDEEGLVRGHNLHVKSLRQYKSLEGHNGCVNTLSWNESGSLLASGSDDRVVKIWRFHEGGESGELEEGKLVESIETHHVANVFGANFLPGNSDTLVVSCAGDDNIFLHDLGGGQGNMQHWDCSQNRVKKLAIAPNESFLFWTGGEDGVVRQYDIREKAKCASTEHRSPTSCKTCLLNMRACRSEEMMTTYNPQVRTISINPVYPMYLAVGCNDPFVDIYDRRMIRKQQFGNTSVFQLFPAHLKLAGKPQTLEDRISVTHVGFSSCGRKAIVSYLSEQIYTFDLNETTNFYKFNHPESAQDPNGMNDFYFGPGKCHDSVELSAGASLRDWCNCRHNATEYMDRICRPIKGVGSTETNSKFFEDLKKKAAMYFRKEQYLYAYSTYKRALKFAVSDDEKANCYNNMGISLLKRNWCGDKYESLLCCEKAVKMGVERVDKAFHRIMHVLYDLKRYAECLKVYELLKEDGEVKLSKSMNVIANHAEEKLAEEEQRKSSGRKYRSHSPDDDDGENSSSDGEDEESSPDEEDEVDTHWQREKLKMKWRRYPRSDFQGRYSGHCNANTDIKEAIFFGPRDEFIMSGSDDGNIIVWDSLTGEIIKIVKGDSAIVNCLCPHPTQPYMFASSGIDSEVKLWRPEEREEEDEVYREAEKHQIEKVTDVNAEKLKNAGTSIFDIVNPRIMRSINEYMSREGRQGGEEGESSAQGSFPPECTAS